MLHYTANFKYPMGQLPSEEKCERRGDNNNTTTNNNNNDHDNDNDNNNNKTAFI